MTNSEKVNGSEMTGPQTLDLAELVDLHGDYLYRYAYSRMRDASLAEDAVQETMLAALRGSDAFSRKSSPRTWLTGILKHKVTDQLRRASRQVQFDCDDDADRDDFFDKSGAWNFDSAPVSWKNTTEDLFERKEFMTILEECIFELPRNLAVAFTLREIEGLDSSEVCEILNISAGNFSVIMHRARLRLRRSLERKWFAKENRQQPVFGRQEDPMHFASPSEI
ncbi:MAG TPA: sigma-70 family RNA polymerase sigma factor [Pyrinomonadaceae bacterium]|jgi:RNA polymerase sigma-70 factor (ECF subfamily)|nr:sigma-70 family RNA polymerase sigma factor [Pyrinomonadaceae bacterium]